MITAVRVQNFKTFEAATIPLRDSHVGVLGPNSAGKSNLAEAICFALCLNDERARGEVRRTSATGPTSVELTLASKRTFQRTLGNAGSIYWVDGSMVPDKSTYVEALEVEFGNGYQFGVIGQSDTGFWEKTALLNSLEAIVTPPAVVRGYEDAQRDMARLQVDAKQMNSRLGLQKKKLQGLSADEELLQQRQDMLDQMEELQRDQALHQLNQAQKNLRAAQTQLERSKDAQDPAHCKEV